MKISDRLLNIQNYVYNPGAMQRSALNILRDVTEGKVDVVDATNPFVFALETTAVNTATFIAHNEALNRKQYPAAALTYEDLYMHMSDKDYVGRFALPSRAVFTLMLNKNELLNSLVYDSLTDISKITIPKDSKFKVGDIVFTLQYPIDIKQLSHGGLQITYDTTEISPLEELQSNIIDWEEQVDPDNIYYIKLSFNLYQFNIITKYAEVTKSSGSSLSIDYNDNYYYCRVYKLNSFNNWEEVYTTHNDQIYNPNKATVILKLLDKKLNISIPNIYANNGLLLGKLRVDLYETKGNINLLMSNYRISDFSAEFSSIDEKNNTVYSAAINDIKTMFIYSTDQTKGGRLELSFQEQTNRVINNSTGPRQIPITNIQLENSITDAGYEFVKNIDTITNRVYLATKSMISPINDRLVTAAAGGMSRVTINRSEALSAYGVNVNDKRITLTSNCLYKNTNGIVKLVSKQDYSRIDTFSNRDKVDHLNNNSYSYSPFHYCLDIDTSVFGVRPYYLDNPQVISKSFVSENSSSSIVVGIGNNYSIEKTNTGYKLIVKTKSNELFKQLADVNVFCQIAYKSTGETLYSYMLGTQLIRQKDTDERVFVFNMESDFDIDQLHRISQNSFRFSSNNLSNYSDLLQDFHLMIITNSQTNSSTTVTDSVLGRFQLPDGSIALSHEKLKIQFGYYLNSLWVRAKSVASVIDYLKYEEDIPAVYEDDVYDVDPTTGAIFDIVDGEIEYNILHNKGDVIRDSNNAIVYKHRIGDVVLDSSGNPIPSSVSQDLITRYIDIAMIEGVYKFITDPTTNDYKKLMVTTMVDWIVNDLPYFNLSLLDQTRIYFHPKVTLGNISVKVGENKTISIPADQSFEVTLNVTYETYKDSSLIAEIEKITISTINNSLNNNTISISNIEKELINRYGKDVLGIELSGFGPDKNYQLLTIVDKQSKMNIKKKLELLPNDQIILLEDVKFNYIRH